MSFADGVDPKVFSDPLIALVNALENGYDFVLIVENGDIGLSLRQSKCDPTHIVQMLRRAYQSALEEALDFEDVGRDRHP